jgi:hypothetical protein
VVTDLKKHTKLKELNVADFEKNITLSIDEAEETLAQNG